jgi:hypothetical protein
MVMELGLSIVKFMTKPRQKVSFFAMGSSAGSGSNLTPTLGVLF